MMKIRNREVKWLAPNDTASECKIRFKFRFAKLQSLWSFCYHATWTWHLSKTWMELVSSLSYTFSGCSVNTSGNVMCPFLWSSCSHKRFHASCILISLSGDHFSNLQCMCIHVFRPLLMLFSLTWNVLSSSFSSLITFQNLAPMYFFQGKLS